VRRHGILQPLLVAPADEGEGFRVIAGHRRLAAAGGRSGSWRCRRSCASPRPARPRLWR
jgi:hypothetical protein